MKRVIYGMQVAEDDDIEWFKRKPVRVKQNPCSCGNPDCARSDGEFETPTPRYASTCEPETFEVLGPAAKLFKPGQVVKVTLETV